MLPSTVEHLNSTEEGDAICLLVFYTKAHSESSIQFYQKPIKSVPDRIHNNNPLIEIRILEYV